MHSVTANGARSGCSSTHHDSRWRTVLKARVATRSPGLQSGAGGAYTGALTRRRCRLLPPLAGALLLRGYVPGGS